MAPSSFDVLAEPARRRLLDQMIDGPRPVGELAREAGLSQPNTSRHLRVLREAGLVESSVAGRSRLYGLRAEGFAEVARWLTPYVLLWQRGLAAPGQRPDEQGAAMPERPAALAGGPVVTARAAPAAARARPRR